ncbi:hypothetical protein DM43_4331 [Burkholderia cepacia]|uniref:Uncharacterized protein n=1 Tax=Burkholderia cepacia TaxID=292 RepID=A0AA88Z857_BURCE|nr:hypothetical protein DM43_4331 [Burkholderia cepacia]
MLVQCFHYQCRRKLYSSNLCSFSIMIERLYHAIAYE